MITYLVLLDIRFGPAYRVARVPCAEELNLTTAFPASDGYLKVPKVLIAPLHLYSTAHRNTLVILGADEKCPSTPRVPYLTEYRIS